MICRRMVFCEIICQISKTWAPVNFELALFHPIFDPIKAHVHGFCAFLFECTIAVPCGSVTIRFHWYGGAVCAPIPPMLS
jgi:hypothetical protein